MVVAVWCVVAVVSGSRRGAQAGKAPRSAGFVDAGGGVAGFRLADVSFIDGRIGWALGESPCVARETCARVLRTRDGGLTWTALPEPPATAPSWVGADTLHVTRIHFANESDGWLWARNFVFTHDGGMTWSSVTAESSSELWTRMQRDAAQLVLDVGSDAERAYVFLGCDPRGHCPNPAVVLEAPLGTDHWEPAQGISRNPYEYGRFAVGGGQVLLQSNDHNTSEGYLFGRSPVGTWTPRPYPCEGWGVLRVGGPGHPMVACAVPHAGEWGTQLHASTDDGQTWEALPASVQVGHPKGLAADDGSILLVTLDGGLLVSQDAGRTFTTAYPAAASIDVTPDGVAVALVGP